MQSWLRLPEPILRGNMACLYLSNSLFAGPVKAFAAANPAMPTLELVDSTHVFVCTFAPCAQTLRWTCQDLLCDSRLKARGRIFCSGSLLDCVDLSFKHKIGFLGFSHHVGAFTRKHSGCAWSIRWTCVFVGKQCVIFKLPLILNKKRSRHTQKAAKTTFMSKRWLALFC